MRVLLSLMVPPEADDKATLDTEKLTEDVPRGLQKVELDLDDALFLDVEEEEPKPKAPEPETPPAAPQPESAPEPAKTPLWKRPLVLAAAGVLLFLLGGLAVYFLLPTQEAAPPPPPPKEEKKPQKPPEEKPITLHTITFEPFMIEYDQNGTTRFLNCKFSISGIPDILEWEIRRKRIILRDAVYYYLRNKGLSFLSDTKNAEKLKEDILAVMNQYLGNGQIETLLIDEYVIR
ncbi:MAG: flagellar basal body-associated FliL family protein [Desulfomicrobiaceae bacterium]|jgi:flagellar FliL protein|nr:flagellar basal body-associated FliL family protein [Desulfomicrobiaceae bacterium]